MKDVRKKKEDEPTPDQISLAILKMFNTLVLLNNKQLNTPFLRNVKEAVEGFNKPELRTSLVDRLYHPERYVTPPETGSHSCIGCEECDDD